MTEDGPTAGTRVYQWVFTGSLAVALYVTLAFVGEIVAIRAPLSGWRSMLAGVTSTSLIAIGALFLIRMRYTRFLHPVPEVTTPEGLGAILLWSVPTYVVLVLVSGTLLYLFLPRQGDHWPLVVYGLALWAPAWLAVPPATAVAWWRTYRLSARTS